MIQSLKQFFIEFLVKNGYKFTKITKRKKINKLIKSLYPYRTQYKLIRLGPTGDGGYLLPDYLNEITTLFSPGVSDESGFELDCINRGIKVFMADKSVEKPNLQTSSEKYNFIKKFIGIENNDEYITLDEWVDSSGIEDNDLMLQMDIEGAEYEAILCTSQQLMNRFRIIIIEFHFLDRLWEPRFFNTVNSVFDKILKTHICVHNHPNNCCGIYSQYNIEIPRVIELTFIRKDCVSSKQFETIFPNDLDFDNTSEEHIVLPNNWFYHKQ